MHVFEPFGKYSILEFPVSQGPAHPAWVSPAPGALARASFSAPEPGVCRSSPGRAAWDSNRNHPFQALRPAQRREWFVAVHPALRLAPYDLGTVREVRREQPMKAREIQFRPRNQGGQSGNENERQGQ